MRKKVGIIKRISCIGLIFLLSINSFAAVVSDNDGSAFITKAEFDALKSSFQSQIDTYNQSIDSKIDGAIASYLSGIKLTKKQDLKFIVADSVYNKSKTFRESWQELNPGSWNNYFQARCWFQVWYRLEGTGAYMAKAKISNTAYNDGGGGFQISRKANSNTENSMNQVWLLNTLDQKEHVNGTERIYIGIADALNNYYQTFDWNGTSFSYADLSTNEPRSTNVSLSYDGTQPGKTSKSLDVGKSLSRTTDLYALQSYTREEPDFNGSNQANNNKYIYLCEKVPTDKSILCMLSAYMNDWNQTAFDGVCAQGYWKQSQPWTELGSGHPGSRASKADSNSRTEYGLNFYWTSTGPYRQTYNVSKLYVSDLTNLMGEDVFYFSGIPVCTVDKPCMLTLTYKLNYNNPKSYTDLKCDVSFNSEKFENSAASDIVGSGTYSDSFLYYKANCTDTSFKHTIDLTDTNLQFPFTLWMRLKPNHGASGLASSELVTVIPEFTEIIASYED